jgi:hypothetical protein
VILAVFDDENSTEAALKQLKVAKGEPRVQAAVAMFKDANGSRFRYKEVGLTPGKRAGRRNPGRDPGYIDGRRHDHSGAAGALLRLAGRKNRKAAPHRRINQVVARSQRGLRPSWQSWPIRTWPPWKDWPTLAPIYYRAHFRGYCQHGTQSAHHRPAAGTRAGGEKGGLVQ